MLEPQATGEVGAGGEPAGNASGFGTRMNETRSIEIAALVMLHDEELVDEAYRHLLGREPDPEGRERYLTALRTGALTKVEFVAALRYSPEGRQRGVLVKGLGWRYLVRRVCRVPVLGYLLDLLISFLSLPGFSRRSRAFHSALAYQVRRSSATVELLTRELGTQLPKIGDLLAGLPGRADVEALVARLETKADQDALSAMTGRLEETRAGLKRLEAEVRRQQLRLDAITDGAGGALDDGALADQLYMEFEETFRGSRAEITRRLEAHLDVVREAMERTGGRFVIDLGCGRGEWLELLRSREIRAHGVDRSPLMVAHCQQRGLVATEADVLTYLREQPESSCAAVSAFHLIEHLPFPTLLGLIEEAARVVLSGGVVLLETPNPENLIVGACTFYTDPGHRRPLVPEAMRFLMSRCGLVDVEVRRLHRYDELHSVKSDDPHISRWLYGEMDYAVVGRKP